MHSNDFLTVAERIAGLFRIFDFALGFVIKLALVLFIGMWATKGHAAAIPPCYPGETASHNDQIETQPQAMFQWASSPKASFTVSWWCDEKYTWHAYGWMGWKSELVPDFLGELDRIKQASHVQRDAEWIKWFCLTKNPDGTCLTWKPKPTATDPVYGELKPIWDRQAALSKPDPIVWVTKENPGSTSRPVFNVVAGVRQTTAVSNNRVAINAPCACLTIGLEESAGTYCDVSALENVATTATDTVGANRVAICKRIAP